MLRRNYGPEFVSLKCLYHQNMRKGDENFDHNIVTILLSYVFVVVVCCLFSCDKAHLSWLRNVRNIHFYSSVYVSCCFISNKGGRNGFVLVDEKNRDFDDDAGVVVL